MPLSFDYPSGHCSPTATPSWSDLTDPVRRTAGWYLPVRAVAEWLAAAAMFVAALPFIVGAIVLVRLTSRGKAVFAQTRVGLDGREFTIYKLRSMYHDCEKKSGPCWSATGDPRVTPVGRVLRFTHLDELPQLWNVLRGDMSLIGPRPERPVFVAKLSNALPRYQERLLVRPGITGLAQVQAPPDTGDLNSSRCKLMYDLYYIQAMGPWLDLRILASTALKMVGVKFPVLRKLFAMPAPEQVESHYLVALPADEPPSKVAMQPA
jgi:lipopolysaccharide/colanic/teichoic acid biosynthesis glycosyltransferase